MLRISDRSALLAAGRLSEIRSRMIFCHPVRTRLGLLNVQATNEATLRQGLKQALLPLFH